MHSLGKTLLAFALLHFVLHGQTCLLLQYLLNSYFCSPILYDEKDIFFLVLVLEGLVGLHGMVQPALLVEAQTWVTVIVNGLPWKWTEVILSFFRLCPSTAFQTLLWTMMVTPFLLRDSCPQ